MQKWSPELLNGTVPAQICAETVEVDGNFYGMTADAEEKLAQGRNFEHSKGSIHSNKLELLFQLYSTWITASKVLKDATAKEACILAYILMKFLFFFIARKRRNL